MPDGFEVQVDELDKAADECLTPVADYLWQRAKEIKKSHLEAGGDMATRLVGHYNLFVDEIGDRQTDGCARIDDTAKALKDIADLYRRADGQD